MSEIEGRMPINSPIRQKAVLVIDMPSSCDKCPLFNSHYSDMTCKGNGRTINYPYPKDFRQDWCPLVPMPEKVPKDGQECFGELRYMDGWNGCLEAIRGNNPWMN